MAKEVAVDLKLKQMYELQLVDSDIGEIEILKGELPMEVSDLEDEIAGLETRINRLSGDVDNVKADVARHGNNIKESEALIEKYNKQMDNVKNNREYDALSKELELQKLEIQLSEKKSREAAKTLTAKEETLKAAQLRHEQKIKDLEVKKVELEKIKLKTEKEEEKLLRKSERLRKRIEDRLLKAYDKIRSSYRNRLSVVTVQRDSCGGCYNQIPPQVQVEIGNRKKIIACEHCGRILVDDDILSVGKKPKEPKEETASVASE